MTFMNVTRRINCHDREWIKEKLDEKELAPTRTKLSTKKTSRRDREIMVDRLYGSVRREQQKKRDEDTKTDAKSVERARERCWGSSDACPPAASPPRNSSASFRSQVSARGTALHSHDIRAHNDRWIDEERERIELKLAGGRHHSVRRQHSTTNDTSHRRSLQRDRSRSFDHSYERNGHDDDEAEEVPSEDMVPGKSPLTAAQVGFSPVPVRRSKELPAPVPVPGDADSVQMDTETFSQGKGVANIANVVRAAQEAARQEDEENDDSSGRLNDTSATATLAQTRKTNGGLDATTRTIASDAPDAMERPAPEDHPDQDDARPPSDEREGNSDLNAELDVYHFPPKGSGSASPEAADDAGDDGEADAAGASPEEAEAGGGKADEEEDAKKDEASSDIDSDEEMERLLRRAKQAAGVDL